MRSHGIPSRFVASARAVVRSDERAILLFLVLLSIVALAVFLHYTVALLDGLPEVLPPGAIAVIGLIELVGLVG